MLLQNHRKILCIQNQLAIWDYILVLCIYESSQELSLKVLINKIGGFKGSFYGKSELVKLSTFGSTKPWFEIGFEFSSKTWTISVVKMSSGFHCGCWNEVERHFLCRIPRNVTHRSRIWEVPVWVRFPNIFILLWSFEYLRTWWTSWRDIISVRMYIFIGCDENWLLHKFCGLNFCDCKFWVWKWLGSLFLEK